VICIFLDRDGVINHNKADYVRKIEEVTYIPGAFEGLARLANAGLPTVIVSNQAGVGHGLIAPEELERIDQKILHDVSAHGGKITASYYCTHRKDASCDCRKPRTGLFEKAQMEIGANLSDSFFIGDAASDIEAGKKAGLRTILVLTGRTPYSEVEGWKIKPDHISVDLIGASHWILDTVGCTNRP